MHKSRPIKYEVDTETGCWNCTSHKTGSHRYHCIGINGKPYLVHRVMYERYKGEIPKGMHVLHHCDNRSCCNPDHLFIGTNLDNIRDMCTKGRQARGERNAWHKLTAKQVRAIRKASVTKNQYDLAEKYNLNQSTISRILRGKTWKHLIDKEPICNIT